MHSPQRQARTLGSPVVPAFPSEHPMRASLPSREAEMLLDLGLGTAPKNYLLSSSWLGP